MSDNAPIYNPTTGIQYSEELAEMVGIPAAIVYEHLRFWNQVNTNNGTTRKNGYTWTYQGVKDIAQKIRGLTEKQVRAALKKLEEKMVIFTGFFGGYYRAKWYRLSRELPRQKQPEVNQEKKEDKPKSPGVSHLPKRENGFAQTGKSLQIHTKIQKPLVSQKAAPSRGDLLESVSDEPIAQAFTEKERTEHADNYLIFCQGRGQATVSGFVRKLQAKLGQAILREQNQQALEQLSEAKRDKLAALTLLNMETAAKLESAAISQFSSAA